MLKLFGHPLLGRKPVKAPLAKLVSQAPEALETAVQAAAKSKTGQVAAPALLIATGAGVAFLWWTQWARGQAESAAEAEGGASSDD